MALQSEIMTSLIALLALSTMLQFQHVTGIPESDLKHECLRTCEWPPQPKTCVYHFNVEWFYSMATPCRDCPINKTDCTRQNCIQLNGVARPVAVVNRLLPGPSIQVCENDTITVHVFNDLANNEGLAIHWHGLEQRGTPYMDGVPMVTQCLITRSTPFTYSFNASSYGTHWWHAHGGTLRSDGVFGSLVIRQPLQVDLSSALYDYDLPEHVVAVHDWFDEMTFPRYLDLHYKVIEPYADSILINGKGRRKGFKNPNGNETIYTEREEFTVRVGKRYRFRLFSNAIVICPLKISVDSHKLTIIASDGRPLEPYETDAFVIHGAESFDFVLETNQEVGNYWMRVQSSQVRTDSECLEAAYELALIRYEGAPDGFPPEAPSPDYRPGQDWNDMASSGNITRKLSKALRKDTVVVQDGGYAVIRFKADNPGWWLLHCHAAYHALAGMAVLIHVGTDSDLPPKPDQFPRCGPWPYQTSTSSTAPIWSTHHSIFIVFSLCVSHCLNRN